MENDISKNWWDEDVEDKEEMDTQIEEYDITSSPNDFNINTIFDFITSGVVEIPGFQRNYVWDKKGASKLIESIIIGLPIPQIFLYEKSKNRFLVIDGQQRLMSIYYFIKQRFPRMDKRSILRKIFVEHDGIPDEVLHNDDYFEKFNLKLPVRLPDQPNKFNGLNYSTLGEFKSAFDLRVIRNVIIKQNFPKDDDSAIYEIFNRLNSGGINLTPQEIRTSLYHSKFYEMLYRINMDERWRRMIGLKEPDLHMKDIEFLLRGFAILINGEKYKPSMTKFLNSFSRSCKGRKTEEIEYLGVLFSSFLDNTTGLGADAFYSNKNRFSITRFEAVFAAICEQPFQNKDFVRFNIFPDRLEKLKMDEEFITACQSETASAINVATRRKRAKKILLNAE